MGQECKQTVENCCKLCDNKAKLEVIKMLLESVERKASSESMECRASSSSDDETMIPDNTQAQILQARPQAWVPDAAVVLTPVFFFGVLVSDRHGQMNHVK